MTKLSEVHRPRTDPIILKIIKETDAVTILELD